MRDIDEVYTKGGTPLITVITRIAFAAYFVAAIATFFIPQFPNSQLEPIWIVYHLGLYVIAEWLYYIFKKRGIDLTFAWPLLFTIYMLNFSGLLLGGQEQLPLMNRAEHFASFVLLTYIVWVFFNRYLPQDVWEEHPYYTALLTLAVTSMAGVGNELIELLIDRIFATRLIGYDYDTSLDLLMNSLGSGMFLAVRLILGSAEKTVAKIST